MCSPRSSPRRPRMLTGLLATPDVSRYVQQRKEVASQDDQPSPRSLVPKSYQSPRSHLSHRYNFGNNSAGPGTTAIADAAATAFVGTGRVSSQPGKIHYATDHLGQYQYQQRQPWEHQQDNPHNHQGAPAPASALSSLQPLGSLPSCQFLQPTEGLQPLLPPTPTSTTNNINSVSSRAASFNYSQTPRHSSVTSAASGSTLSVPTVPVVAAAPALPAVPAARTLPSQSNELKVLLDRNAMTNKRMRDSRCFESNYKMSLHPYGRSGNSQGGQCEHHSHCIHVGGHDVGDSQSHQRHQQSSHHQCHQSSCLQQSHNYSNQHHSHQSSHRSPQQHSSFVSSCSSARSQSAPSRQGSEHGTSASICGSVYPPYVHGVQTVNMPSDAILGQALEIARDSDDGPSDPHIHNILEAALCCVYQRVSRDPEISLTPTQFSLWNYMQHRFRGGPEETLWRIVTVKYWSEYHE